MPRTKLDKLAVKPNEASKRAVKAAMARNGIDWSYQLADELETDAGFLSKCFKNGFSEKMVLRMDRVLHFNENEWAALGGKTGGGV